MLTEDELRTVLRDLDNVVPRERVLTLQVLESAPTGSPALLPRLRQLLADDTPSLIGLPYLYGEVRWVAAHTLAAELRAAGSDEPVVVRDVPYPVRSDELGRMAEAAQIRTGSGHDGYLAAFTELRARGLLELTTLTL